MSHMEDLNALMSRVNKSGDKDSIKFVRKLIAAVKEGDKGAVKGIVHFNRDQANLVPASVTKWLKESADMDIQEDEWGGGFQSYADAHKQVQAGLKADHNRERTQKLKWIVQVIRGEISKQKFRKLAGISFDEIMTTRYRNWYVDQVKRMSKKALAPVNPPAPAAPTATESVDMDIQEAEKAVAPNDDELRRLLDAANEILWGRGGGHSYFQRDAEAKKLVNKAKKFAMVTRDEGLRLNWIDLNYHLKGVKVRKPKPNLNRSFGGVHDPRSYGRGGVADSYEAEGDDIQEKVEIDGRTRAYRNTVMRLEQARRLRGGKGTEMQENKFAGLYDDGSGKGAIIPAPVDYNFQEAMKIVEKYRTLREKKKTLFGAPKGKMEDLEAAVAMKGGKFSMAETEMSPKQKEYRAFFAKALKKFGHKSPADMDIGEKKKFFNWIEKNWKG